LRIELLIEPTVLIEMVENLKDDERLPQVQSVDLILIHLLHYLIDLAGIEAFSSQLFNELHLLSCDGILTYDSI